MVTDDCHGEHVNDTVNIDAPLYVNIDVRGAHCKYVNYIMHIAVKSEVNSGRNSEVDSGVNSEVNSG